MSIPNSLSTFNQQLAQMMTGRRLAVPTLPGPHEATVISTTSSTVTVVLADTGWEEVPFTCPYQPVPGSGNPPAGTECVVVFVGNGLDKPYVSLFVGWPT